MKDLESTERETMAPAVDARTRVWGIDVGKAVSPLAGSYVGRLLLQGDLNRQQYDAAMLYAEQCRDYRIAIRGPQEPNAVNPNATRGGESNYENIRRTQQARAAYEAAQRALVIANMEPSNRGCNLIGALEATVVQDLAMDTLLGSLRPALNVLVRHYGLGSARAA